MKGSGKITSFTARGPLSIVTGGSIREIGSRGKWKVEGFTPGRLVNLMKGSTGRT